MKSFGSYKHLATQIKIWTGNDALIDSRVSGRKLHGNRHFQATA